VPTAYIRTYTIAPEGEQAEASRQQAPVAVVSLALMGRVRLPGLGEDGAWGGGGHGLNGAQRYLAAAATASG
jgi:hypothetical protein